MCHLGEFVGQNEIPKVAGQNYDYVVKTMKDFKAKNRTNDAGNMTSVASTLSEALRIAKDVDASKAKQEAELQAELEALEREEREQTERDAMAFRLQRQIEDDKASGAYQRDLIAKARTIVEELRALGVEVELTVAETVA